MNAFAAKGIRHYESAAWVPRLLRSRQEASGRKLSGLCPFLR